jgi:hypothetical protein
LSALLFSRASTKAPQPHLLPDVADVESTCLTLVTDVTDMDIDIVKGGGREVNLPFTVLLQLFYSSFPLSRSFYV